MLASRPTLNLSPLWYVILILQQGKLSVREGGSWPEAGWGLKPECDHSGALIPGALCLSFLHTE